VVLLGIGEHAGTRPIVAAAATDAPWCFEDVFGFAVELSPPPDERSDVAWTTDLPEALSNARDRRLATFLAGRYCAARALNAAGAGGDVRVDFGAEREPLWPAGFVGSITHTTGFAGAVVARDGDVVSLGIDTENLLSDAQARELRQTVAPELAGINFVGLDADGRENAPFVSCVFSAKESIYKCLHPLVREFFEFSDVSVTAVDRVRGTIHAVLNRPLGVFPRHWPVDVRFVLANDLVHTSTILRAHQLPSLPPSGPAK
jgi:enterobactin synthetase component D